ncbi:MAG TPA: glycosyltransferase family 4 protein [Streptosporangiaceae bacterium]|nr:glycosyltransferase family 4 protein [Streptosporangiaceae bacterium]
MRIIVCPNSLNLGGSINAVEIAAAVRDRGHEVTVLAKPGPLLDLVIRSGLDYVPLAEGTRRRPARRTLAQLNSLTRGRQADVVHAYEWPAAIEACAGPRLDSRTPVVCTVYSALVAPFLPRRVPLIVGTLETKDRAVAAGRHPVTLIEPPVDTRANSPELDPGSFRADHGLDEGAPLVAVVSRIAPEGKIEGLLAACDSVGGLATAGRKVQLAVVGDGPARGAVARAAAAANARAGRQVVTLTGPMSDPRPAYAAADVVLGMGGSALRGMAFGKPLVVQGEHGFWRLLTAESAPEFLYQGWYGLGTDRDGRRAGASRLSAILADLLDNVASWGQLGEFGRSLVDSRFSLGRAAATAEHVYTAAICRPPSLARAAADAATGLAGAARHKVRRKWDRARGRPVATDDFNAIAAHAELWRGGR